MKTTRDPKLYREMSVPFSSQDEAGKALNAFLNDVGELRKKHRIRDVMCIIGCSWMDGEVEAEGITSGGFGDSLQHERMAAFAMGQLQAERQLMVGEMMKGYRKVRQD